MNTRPFCLNAIEEVKYGCELKSTGTLYLKKTNKCLLDFRAEMFKFCATFYSRNFFLENAGIQIIRHIENTEIC
jgi:hypothetical protein